MAKFGRTWWGERFLSALERFTDPGRLRRGRAYATNGRVTSHTIANGTVTAKVRGTINPYYGVEEEPLYTTTIAISQFSAADWAKVIARIGARADLVTKLLQGEMPDAIEGVFAEDRLNLLPQSKNEFRTRCSCPDWDNPCKHVAGVYYLLARDLDHDPFVLFELRGLTRKALHAELVKTPLGQALASSLQHEVPKIVPATSLHTRPTKVGEEPASATTRTKKRAASRKPAEEAAAPAVSYRDFWIGPRRLPPTEPAPSPASARVSALLVKKQGDNPPFWQKDISFIDVMEELYDRIRTKSPQLK